MPRTADLRMVEGFSRSLWISLGVKSVRLGWPAGFHRAREVVGGPPSYWRDMLYASTFEDTWPSRDYQLSDVIREAEALDVAALCRRDPHHGERQLSERYAGIAPEVEATLWTTPLLAKGIGDAARSLGLPWLGRRALSEFAIWLEADPPPGGIRAVDESPREGMPPAMADLHTSEGRRLGTLITLLCGHPKGHIGLMREVQAKGWGGVRAEVHGEPPLEPTL